MDGRAARRATFTIDVEEFDHPGAGDRVEAVTDRILAFLDERGIRATAFVVGTLAADRPALVRRIAAGGHEVGLHGDDHRLLGRREPAELTAGVRDARARLADLAGRPVEGFRAPIFSLTPATAWVADALGELGFTYSASVVPAAQARGDSGFPGAPDEPFRWPNGLVELPSGVYARVPVGGAYARLMPGVVFDRMVRSLHGDAPWLYVHPYDFDDDEPYTRLPGTGRVENRLLFARRRLMFDRIARALRDGAGPPLGERVAALDRAALPTFSPVS